MENFTGFEQLNSILDSTDILIIDFSAIVNSDYVRFDEFMHHVIEKKLKTAVTAEFYENYEIICKSSNAEQKAIGLKVCTYLGMLKERHLLLSLPDVYDSRTLVTKLESVRSVCYMFYKVSELAEALAMYGNRFKSIVVDENKNLIGCELPYEMITATANTVDPDAAGDGYFSIDNLPEEGHTVYLADRTPVRITKFLASGGEGGVYDCTYKTGYLAKVYHDGQLNALRVKKMLQMEKKQVRYEGLCWPEHVLFTQSGEPIGFVMKKVQGSALSVLFDSYESVLNQFPHWKRRNLIQLCIEVLSRIQYLHLFGILIGDVRLNNIMITTAGEPALVDLDSCQTDNLPCPGGFGEFTPPELQNQQFSKTLRTYGNESFSCAVIMFKILFCGLHPYDQIDGADSIEEDIAKKNFPFTLDTKDDFKKIMFSDYYSEVWKSTPYPFQKFLLDIFKNGERPNIQTMIMMLRTYDKFIELNENKYPQVNEILFDI